MESAPLVSIIVPVYNVEKYIRQCVDSLLHQTYGNFEVILVDDGSTDSSGEICDEYADKDIRIHVLHKRNGGLSSARNAGIDVASGNRIVFLDSDDFWTSTRFLEKIEECNSFDGIIFWRFQKFTDGEKLDCNDEVLTSLTYTLQDDFRYLFQGGLLFASACYLAVPKAMFDGNKLRFIAGDYSEDVEWFAELLSQSRDFLFIDYPIYAYRMRAGSISHSASPKVLIDLQKHIKFLNQYYLPLDNPAINAYIAEQTANFVIVLSRSEVTHDMVEESSNYLTGLRYALRKRSKLIYYSTKLIGLNKTLCVLKCIDRHYEK